MEHCILCFDDVEGSSHPHTCLAEPYFLTDEKVCKESPGNFRRLALCNALFSDVNPIPVKEAMNMMGMNVGDCRLPLYKMTDPAKETLRKTLSRYGLVD